MSPSDRQTILRKLGYLQKNIDLLLAHASVSPSDLTTDPLKRSAIERLLQTAIQSVLDSSRLLVTIEDWRGLRDERDALVILTERKVIDEDLQLRMIRAKGLRNILVHEYTEVDLVQLCAHLQSDLSDLGAFAKSLALWISKHP
ncbi:DUF86 domain-containing protein [Candidatus Peribacteria bacterium]|nr:DUF86 domain-containing protein [Candidatus Peribacteria bacterium]